MEFSLKHCLAAGGIFARNTARYCGLVRESGQSRPSLLSLKLVDYAPYLVRAGTQEIFPSYESATETQRTAIERELRAALHAGRVLACYRPVISLDRQCVIRFEAQPTWDSDRFGRLGSDRLILLAEQVGLTAELDDQLLSRACQDARTWSEQISLAVRVSPTRLRDPLLDSQIVRALSEADFNPRRLHLEITEAALVEPIELVQSVIGLLRRGGVNVALDDFGAGYASLTQLLHFQFDRIKIDSRFIERLEYDADSATITRAIIRLANDFGIGVTAKGINTLEQLATLIASGCHEGQGPLFGGPVPSVAIPVVLSRIESIRTSIQ